MTKQAVLPGDIIISLPRSLLIMTETVFRSEVGNFVKKYAVNITLKVSVMTVAYSKTCLKWSLSKRQKNVFQDQLWLNAGQKYCRMLQGEHSAILSTFIKLTFVIIIFVTVCQIL